MLNYKDLFNKILKTIYLSNKTHKIKELDDKIQFLFNESRRRNRRAIQSVDIFWHLENKIRPCFIKIIALVLGLRTQQQQTRCKQIPQKPKFTLSGSSSLSFSAFCLQLFSFSLSVVVALYLFVSLKAIKFNSASKESYSPN